MVARTMGHARIGLNLMFEVTCSEQLLAFFKDLVRKQRVVFCESIVSHFVDHAQNSVVP